MTKPPNPFRYFDSSPEVIRQVVMMYVRYPLSLRNVEDLLFERGIDICHETVRLWVAKAAGKKPAATPAAEPEDEPPGVWSGLCGFRRTRSRQNALYRDFLVAKPHWLGSVFKSCSAVPRGVLVVRYR